MSITYELPVSTFQTILNLTTALKLEDFQIQDSVLALSSYFGSAIIQLQQPDVQLVIMSLRQNKLLQKFAKSASKLEITVYDENEPVVYEYNFYNSNGKRIASLSIVQGIIYNQSDMTILDRLQDAKPILKFNLDSSLLLKTLETITEANTIKFTVQDNSLIINVKGDDDFSVDIEADDFELLDSEMVPEQFFIQAVNASFLQSHPNTQFILLAEGDQLILKATQAYEDEGVEFSIIFDVTTEDISDLQVNFEEEVEAEEA